MTAPNPLHDGFGRPITYLRLSVTDRCDFRCLYCMAEDMTFLPRSEVLTLEELARIGATFVQLGVNKIRVTGGEPLIRRDAIHLLSELGALRGLDALCLTTNASQLEAMAEALKEAGVTHLNISLDSLDPERFKQLTRFGDLSRVLRGIEEARRIGFQRIKLNAVLMRDFNIDEAPALVEYALSRDLDIRFIEEMPLGVVNSHARDAQHVTSESLRRSLSPYFQLTPSEYQSGGPARYWSVAGFKAKVGFISPHSENFCASCNRVRVTAEGRLVLCLGNEDGVDLKRILREQESHALLRQTIIHALRIKPEKHHFDLQDSPQILRFMNHTGG